MVTLTLGGTDEKGIPVVFGMEKYWDKPLREKRGKQLETELEQGL